MVREGWYVGILLCAEDWNSPASNTGTILKHIFGAVLFRVAKRVNVLEYG